MPTDLDSAVELLPTLVVGAGAAGTQLVRDLQSNPELGLWPIAVVDDDLDKLGIRISGVPVLGAVESIPAVVERERIERVIVAIPSAGEVARQRVTELAQKSGKQVLTMPSLHALVQGAASTDLVSVAPSDLLGRPVIEIDPARAKSFLGGKRVLVTGAAGSIGREVVIQALRGAPAVIYGMDLNESDLYDLQQDLKRRQLKTEFVPVVASVTDSALVDRLFEQLRPQVVFHAAAYKHVPLMEEFPHEAVRTNIVGTWNVANAAAKVGAERFVMVSTDKAVRPSSVMGATKRLAELIVRDISATTELSACAVRFGNVLGSRGSVIPLFERQIEAGGPVTITDKRMTRYFMTIPEAAGLIIEAGAFGDRGVVYMLDMGEPVKIVDVARRLIRLKGLRPDVDIAIEYSGLRPGEKLFEELSLDFESARPTPHSKIRVLDEGEVGRKISAQGMIQSLLTRVENGDARSIRDAVLLKVRAIDGLDLTLMPDQAHGNPSLMSPSISRSAS
jgi:FlaA1/EpsC-like NDP-sugar epimerase